MRSRHWFLKSPKRKSKQSSNNTTNNKKPDLPAGLLASPQTRLHPPEGIEQMNEPTNESQPTPNQTQPAQTNQNKPALAGVCLVCGGGCAVGDTMCARCDGLMRGWLREYSSWLDSLHEFLDSTAHYGVRQPGRVNLPAAPTPIRLPVLDHMQAIEDAAIALWRRLYAPPAMPWATYGVHPPLVDMLRACAGSPRLRRMPDIADFYHEWESMVRKTLDIIDVPPSKHGIGRCPNPLCGVELSAPIDAVEVTCPVCGGTYRVVDVRLGFLKECIASGKAFTAGECAELLRECGFQCGVNTIYSWRSRGRIQPAGKNGKGQPLYRLADVHRQLSRRDSI